MIQIIKNKFVLILFLFLTISCTHTSLKETPTQESISCNDTIAEGSRSPSGAPSCSSLLSPVNQVISDSSFRERKATLIESILPKNNLALTSREQLTQAIEKLKLENPELGRLATEARRAKERGVSLKVDTSMLPAYMVYFLEGPYKEFVGQRGLSKPFVKISLFDEKTMMISHAEDQYPMLVRWNPETTELSRAREITLDGKVYRLLELPATLRAEHELNILPEKYITSLVSASRINKYISPESSRVATVAALLHDEKMVFDRPTQADFKNVRALLDVNEALRRQVRSLLFVAPTGSGKTRILVDGIISKVKSAQKRLSENSQDIKKLTVLMTKTPDLTGDLAKEVGSQLADQVGLKNFRIIQWGGELGESGSFLDLKKFIDDSKVPVVLVTSYPTLAARISSDSEMGLLFQKSNGLFIDEAHNVGGQTFDRVMRSALDVAQADRLKAGSVVLNSLDILGVTGSPLTRIQRTIEIFDFAFWAGIETPNSFAKKITRDSKQLWSKSYQDVLEWIRIADQYAKARDRGEINSPDAPIYYNPSEHGFKFESIFKRGSGTQSSVDIEKLKQIWPDVAPQILGHGPGVIQTYPRDAEPVATALSALTGKNFISLQKLDITARSKVYDAFRYQTDYNGKKVDGIVGTIREGLDFPKSGWYLSFKKYVKFPENIQGPGRVVRMGYDKLPPVIIFFGLEANRIAYQDVRDLIMMKLGRLPRSLPSGRLYTGARRGRPGRPMTKAVDDLNLAMEALIRIKKDLSSKLGDPESPQQDVVSAFQDVVQKIRFAKSNPEISTAIQKFVYEINAFPFFTGDLHSTWSYCDRMLKISKDSAGGKSFPAKLGPNDLATLKDLEMMKMIEEFREIKPTLGSVPRSILDKIDLRPKNLYELAEAVNVFVAKNNRAPFSNADHQGALTGLTREALDASPESFWDHLNPAARVKLDAMFAENKEESFEQAVSKYFSMHNEIPRLTYDMMDDVDRTVADGNSHKLAKRLEAYLKDGTLDVAELGRPFNEAFDKSDFYKDEVGEAAVALQSLKAELAETKSLKYEDLMLYDEFGILRVIQKMSEQGFTNSRQYKKAIENLLADKAI